MENKETEEKKKWAEKVAKYFYDHYNGIHMVYDIHGDHVRNREISVYQFYTLKISPEQVKEMESDLLRTRDFTPINVDHTYEVTRRKYSYPCYFTTNEAIKGKIYTYTFMFANFYNPYLYSEEGKKFTDSYYFKINNKRKNPLTEEHPTLVRTLNDDESESINSIVELIWDNSESLKNEFDLYNI